MFTLKDTYESRKREINSFIELMKFLEGKKLVYRKMRFLSMTFFMEKSLQLT